MALFTNNFVMPFLLITILCFSASGVAEAGVITAVQDLVHGAANRVIPTLGREAQPLPHTLTTIPTEANNILEDSAEKGAKYLGQRLARHYFGPRGEKGFNWGWDGKYYFKVEGGCDKFTQQSCSAQLGACHTSCIFQVAKNTLHNESLSCTNIYTGCDPSTIARIAVCDQNDVYDSCARKLGFCDQLDSFGKCAKKLGVCNIHETYDQCGIKLGICSTRDNSLKCFNMVSQVPLYPKP